MSKRQAGVQIDDDLIEEAAQLVMRWEESYGGDIQSETASEDLVRAILSLCGIRCGLVLHQVPGRWSKYLPQISQHP